jgi:hypothetical protein
MLTELVVSDQDTEWYHATVEIESVGIFKIQTIIVTPSWASSLSPSYNVSELCTRLPFFSPFTKHFSFDMEKTGRIYLEFETRSDFDSLYHQFIAICPDVRRDLKTLMTKGVTKESTFCHNVPTVTEYHIKLFPSISLWLTYF